MSSSEKRRSAAVNNGGMESWGKGEGGVGLAARVVTVESRLGPRVSQVESGSQRLRWRPQR